MAHKNLVGCPLLMLAFFTSFFVGCEVSKSVPKSPKTETTNYILSPNFRAFRFSPDSIRLFFEIDNSEVLYVRNGEEANFRSNLSLLWDWNTNSDHEDEWSFEENFGDIGSNKETKTLQGHVDMLIPNEARTLSLMLKDNNRKASIIQIFNVNKASNYGALLLRNAASNKPLIAKEYIDTTQLLVDNPQHIPFIVKEVYFKYLHPLPMFYANKEAKKQFDHRLLHIPQPNRQKLNVSDSCDFVLVESGEEEIIYSFSRISALNSIRGSGKSFGLPLRYIMNKEEYNGMEAANFSKSYIENFWSSIAGNEIRSKKIAEVYYDRVTYANGQFSSFKPGFLTDRGMVFIVFGKPTNIYRRSTHETWVYGDENNMMALSFTFSLEEIGPFGKDFILSRSPSYKNLWFRAVETWRNGRYTTF